MITDSFHKNSNPVITPKHIYDFCGVKLDVCIVNFSEVILEDLIENEMVEVIPKGWIKSIIGNTYIYRFKNTNIGIFKTGVGAPLVGGHIEEIAQIFDCKKFVLFGSCGVLDKSIDQYSLIVPTAAYRDEGMSYHYLEPSDYIDIKNHQIISDIFDNLGVRYVKGKTWTNDAFYRETREEVEERRKDGCLTVEMEISACQAICDYYGYDFYAFLYRSDNLDASDWQKSKITLDDRITFANVAYELAQAVK